MSFQRGIERGKRLVGSTKQERSHQRLSLGCVSQAQVIPKKDLRLMYKELMEQTGCHRGKPADTGM